MSTAEQIIAEVVHEHTPKINADPWTQCSSRACEDWPGGNDEAFGAHVAAHVVAALTNAGKTIVELPEPDRIFDGDLPEYDVADDGMVHVTEEPGGRVVVWHQNAEIRDPDAVAGALLAAGLAAARVAEGGERGE